MRYWAALRVVVWFLAAWWQASKQNSIRPWRNALLRKLIVLEHISLDGVIQAPGGRDEDPSGGFAHGGWAAPYSDEVAGAALRKMMDAPFDLLLGRKTFAMWAQYWPHHADIWGGVNTATKYVVSNTMTSHEWQPSVFLNGDVVEKVAHLKQQEGRDLHLWGSSDLLQTLLKHDLVDIFWLLIYPVTIGSGKRLFAGGAIPAAFTLTEGAVTPSGIVVVRYERAGALQK
jgi:dihydrofolate reductase